MSLATRSKPFRYAQAKPIKAAVYKMPALSGPPVYSSGIAASEQTIAVGYGSSKGSVLLLPTDASQHKASGTPFTIGAHGCELGDLTWSPFAPASSPLLATGAADGTVKIWNVPNGGALTANISTPATKFDGMDSVHSLAFHPSAEGILAAGSKSALSVFDLTAQAEKYSFKQEGFGKDVTSVHWNRNGSLLSAVTKNCALTVLDPRAGGNALATSVPSTLVKKLQHGVFIGGDSASNTSEFLLLFGVSSAQRPVMMWVDPRNPSAALKTHDFDFSSGYLLPHYEPDTGTMFVTVRGSEMLALLDVESEKNVPTVWPSHVFGASSAIKGYCLLPKRAVATNLCEINRVYTLGAESVEGFTVSVPRKTAGFHAELFPDTADNKAAQTAAEYLNGGNKAPLMTSMVGVHESGGASVAAASAAAAAGLAVSASKLSIDSSSSSSSSGSASSATPSNRAASSSAASAPTPTNKGPLSPVYVPSDVRAKIDSNLKKSVFTHCMGREPPSNFQTYFDTQQGPSLSLAENIRCNSTFFAVPWRASGGSALAVFRLATDALGRCPPTQFCVRGHKFPASSFDFSPFQQTQMATGCVDGTIFLWRIPERGLVKDLVEPESVLSSAGKVSLVRFHPFASDVLLSATSGFDGSFIEVWSTAKVGAQAAPAFSIQVHASEPVIDFAVHPRSHLLAASARDGKVRIFNLTSRAMTAEFAVPEGVKDTRVLWVADSRILTVGFGPSGQRSMTIFDVSGTPKLLQTVELDRINYLPIPRYDPDTKLLFLANSGGTFIPLYAINDAAPFIENLNLFQGSTDTTGWILLPKLAIDVKKVEIIRALKLTKDAILPISYTVPRKRLEFFQDDLFGSTRQAGPEMSGEQFLSGAFPDGKAQTMVSLQPAGMTPLSQAPEEEQTIRQAKYASKLAQDAAPKPVGALGHTTEAEVREHFLSLQQNVGGANRWDARTDNSKVDVDESEWD